MRKRFLSLTIALVLCTAMLTLNLSAPILGAVQACLFIVLLTGCVWLADWWTSPSRWKFKTLWRVSLPYLVSGIAGGLLSIDVLAQTIPPLMEGCRPIPFLTGITHLPSLVTVLFPTLLGVPETIDLFKLMGQDLFDLKFTGGVIFVLAVLGLFNRKAPLTAKFPAAEAPAKGLHAALLQGRGAANNRQLICFSCRSQYYATKNGYTPFSCGYVSVFYQLLHCKFQYSFHNKYRSTCE